MNARIEWKNEVSKTYESGWILNKLYHSQLDWERLGSRQENSR